VHFVPYRMISFYFYLQSKLTDNKYYSSDYNKGVYSAIFMAQPFHAVRVIIKQCQAAANPQTKLTDSGRGSVCCLLSYAPSIAIYYYYSVGKLILTLA